MIKYEKNEEGKWKTRYFDKNGKEIVDGCFIRDLTGKIEKVYLTVDGDLGIDATNPKWIETGKAVECEFGVYPLTEDDTENVEVVE